MSEQGVNQYETVWLPVYPWYLIECALDWACELLGHPGCCWIAFKNPVARFVARRSCRHELRPFVDRTR